MHWIQLSLFQWRNLSVGFRQTAYLLLWNTVNCFSSLDDCKCISFNKFDFQRKTNNCFPILVHCQPTKWGKKVQLACYSNVWQRAKACACCMWKQTHPVEKHRLPRLFPTSVHRNTINDGCKSGANHSVQHRSVFLPEHTSFRLFNDCFARTNLFIHMTKILPRFTRSSAHSLSLMLCFFWTLPRPSRSTYLPASRNPVPIKAFFFFLLSGDAFSPEIGSSAVPKASLQPVCSLQTASLHDPTGLACVNAF